VKPGTRLILELLRTRGAHGVTSLDALASVGCFRLAARVKEIRDAGYAVTSEPFNTPSGKRVARYVLTEELTMAELRRQEIADEIELGLV
jgi:hypothetical protein